MEKEKVKPKKKNSFNEIYKNEKRKCKIQQLR